MNRKEFEVELSKIEPKWKITNTHIWCPEYTTAKEGYSCSPSIDYWARENEYFYEDILHEIKTRHTYPNLKLDDGTVFNYKR
jgi:hypothetical protein